MKKNYDSLYLDILRIGRSKVSEGLSYNVLKELLQSKGYDFENDCIELAVKQWFIDSFTHYDQDLEPFQELKDLDEHLNCNFILKGESALTILEYETSKRNIKIAFYSLTVAMLSLIYPIYHDICTEKENPSKQSEEVQHKKDLQHESKDDPRSNLKIVPKKNI